MSDDDIEASHQPNTGPEAERTGRPLAKRSELSEEQRLEIREAFDLFDASGEGKIEKRELKTAMRALGFEYHKEDVANMLAGKSDNKIGFDEFLELMTSKMTRKDIQEEMLKAFDLFDKDQTGKITFENLKRVSEELGEKMSDDELREMIVEADLDKDGAVNATEFVRIMQKTDLW